MKLMFLTMAAAVAFAADKPTVSTIETETARITVSTKRVGKYEIGCAPEFCAVYMKVENRGEAAFGFDPAKFYMKTSEGKALPWMSTEEFTKAIFGKTTMTMTALLGYRNREPLQQDLAARIQDRALTPGDVPVRSYREGIVYFKGSGDKKSRPATLHLSGISGEPVALTW